MRKSGPATRIMTQSMEAWLLTARQKLAMMAMPHADLFSTAGGSLMTVAI